MKIGHWGSTDWEQKKYMQKGSDGLNLTTGGTYNARAIEYACSVHKTSGEVYPQKSDRRAVITNLAYIALFPVKKALNIAGNATAAAGNLGHAAFTIVKDRKVSKKEAFAPVWGNINQCITDTLLAFAAFSAYTGIVNLYFTSFAIPTLKGYNPAVAAGVALLGLTALHAIYSPQGFQRTVHRYIERINPKPMTDEEVHKASIFQTVKAFVDGRYSLARLLGMHYLCFAKDKKLEEIEKKEK